MESGGSGYNRYVIIKNDEYGTIEYFEYLYIVPDAALTYGDPVTEGVTVIGTTDDYYNDGNTGNDHLHFGYWYNGIPFADYEDAYHPFYILDYTNPEETDDESIYLQPCISFDDNDDMFVEVKCYADESALDFDIVNIYLDGWVPSENTYYLNNELLRGGWDYGEVDFSWRINCGDGQVNDSDVGLVRNSNNELCIHIIPQDFNGSDDQELIFRFYINESNYNKIESLSGYASV